MGLSGKENEQIYMSLLVSLPISVCWIPFEQYLCTAKGQEGGATSWHWHHKNNHV
jgi:hypothetical protein